MAGGVRRSADVFAGVSTPGRVDREVAIEVLRGAAFAAALEESDFDDSGQLAHALDAFTATAAGPALSRVLTRGSALRGVLADERL